MTAEAPYDTTAPYFEKECRFSGAFPNPDFGFIPPEHCEPFTVMP